MIEPNTIAQTTEGTPAIYQHPRPLNYATEIPTGRKSAQGQIEIWAQSMQPSTAALRFLAILAGIEFAWATLAGLQLAQLLEAGTAMALPLALCIVIQATGKLKVLGNVTYFLTLWFGSLLIGKLLTYLAANLGFPLFDAVFNDIDSALGLNWRVWYNFVHSHPTLLLLLTIAYRSLTPQIYFAIFYFSFKDRRSEGEELWWNSLIALIITSLISGILPALGTFHYHATALSSAVHLPDLLALRAGTLHELKLTTLGGIITFPSFHAVSAVLLAHAYRHHTRMYRIAIVLNVLMLLATPSEGGHYFLDVLAGCVVAVVSIRLFSWLKNSHFTPTK